MSGSRIGPGSSRGSITLTGNDALTLSGDAIVYEDIERSVNRVKAIAGRVPAVTTYSGSTVLDFDYQANVNNEKGVTIDPVQLPHKYAEGEDIYFHVHWVPETDDDAAVVWKLVYEWVNINGVFSGTSSIEATQAIDAQGDTHLVTGLGTIDGTGMTISSVLMCSLYRHSSDAADTFDDSAYLVTCDFHYPVNSLGSRTEWVK